MRKQCSIKNCARLVEGRGWCSLHYQRWYKNGDPLKVFFPKSPGALCKVRGCNRPHRARGLCHMHHERWRITGKVGPAQLLTREKGTGTLCRGYLHFMKKGKLIIAHRAVMEQRLGRELNSNEIVHHLNGNGLDNRIENLQIVTRAEHAKIHRLSRWY